MTPAMKETMQWLRDRGFMSTRRIQMTDEEKIRKRGREDGKAVGSWVIDGNTSKESAKEIFEGLRDGDDVGLPELSLGEWADDPTFEDILDEEDIPWSEDDSEKIDDLFGVYTNAWYEGMHEQVEHDARLRMPVCVKITNSDDDDGSVTVWCDDALQAEHDQSVTLEGQSSRWEVCDGAAYTHLENFYDLEKALTDAGYEVDAGEYSPPDDEDLLYWAYRVTQDMAGGKALDRDAWRENVATPVLPKRDATKPE